MTAASAAQPHMVLRFARHIVGMMILALASLYIWVDPQPIMVWTATWMVPVAIALAAFGLFALFFTQRAKAAWPRSFFMLAWLLLVLTVASPYLETFNKEMAKRTAEKSAEEWGDAIRDLIASEAARPGGVDYGADPKKQMAFDKHMAALTNTPGNENKPIQWLVIEAHKLVLQDSGAESK